MSCFPIDFLCLEILAKIYILLERQNPIKSAEVFWSWPSGSQPLAIPSASRRAARQTSPSHCSSTIDFWLVFGCSWSFEEVESFVLNSKQLGSEGRSPLRTQNTRGGRGLLFCLPSKIWSSCSYEESVSRRWLRGRLWREDGSRHSCCCSCSNCRFGSPGCIARTCGCPQALDELHIYQICWFEPMNLVALPWVSACIHFRIPSSSPVAVLAAGGYGSDSSLFQEYSNSDFKYLELGTVFLSCQELLVLAGCFWMAVLSTMASIEVGHCWSCEWAACPFFQSCAWSRKGDGRSEQVVWFAPL